MKKIALLSILLATLTACNTQPSASEGELLVHGTLQNADNLQAYFEAGKQIPLQQGEIKNGSFELRVPMPEPGIYRLRVGAKGTFVVVTGKEKVIEINGDLEKMPNEIEIKDIDFFAKDNEH